MSNYDVIAQFYDSVVADPTKKAEWLKQLIRTYHSDPKSVLELACGTGSLLEILAQDFSVAGLDNSAGMLKVAHERLPNTQLIEANMTSFTVKEKFDVILCIYDSINHLLKFTEWQSMFAKAAEHLEPGGLFIFDMNTVEFLNRLNNSEPSVSRFSDNVMIIGAEPNPKAITTLTIEVVEKKRDGRTKTYRTDIPEMSFSISKVEAMLENSFRVLAKVAEHQITEWQPSADKVVFICQKIH